MPYHVQFPGFGWEFDINPIAFSIGDYKVYWYGIIIACGLLLAVLYAWKSAPRYKVDGSKLINCIFAGIITGIIGARLYFCFFKWDYYGQNPIEILYINNGGLAIYGGVIVAFITVFVYSKIKKLNPFRLMDTALPGLILGQAIGRWGNFFNREVFGEYTDNLLAMRLPIEMVRSGDISENLRNHIIEGTNYIQVHPTYLYESLWCLMVLAIMLIYWKHKRFEGEIALIYLGGYGLGRAWIEGIRTDQLYIHGTTIPVSQVLAIVLVIFSVVCGVVVRIYLKKKEETKKNFVGEDQT